MGKGRLITGKDIGDVISYVTFTQAVEGIKITEEEKDDLRNILGGRMTTEEAFARHEKRMQAQKETG